jgi:hypothetical protein
VVFVTHRGCFQLAPGFYTNAQRAIKSWLSTKDVNIATLAKFEKLWQANIARNAKTYARSLPAGAFYGAFSGMPAVVVAAGPSLTDSADFLRQASGRA